MPKIALLGGSNSVLKDGLKAGLSKNAELYNYALGASTSLQNLHELIKNAELIRSTDCVVTESNVNDFHSVWLADFPIHIVLNNIDKYYEMLAMANTKVLVIIMPLVSTCDIADRINQQHMLNIRRYDFSYINLGYLISNDELLPFYVRDIGHPNKYLMNLIGKNIVGNLNLLPNRVISEIEQLNEYEILDAKDFLLDIKIKNNSIFSRDLITLKSTINFKECYYGYDILGVEAWSDGYSKLKINDDYIKAYNNELQFHDLSSKIEIDECTQLSSDCSKQLPTEFSLNAYLIDSLFIIDSKPEKQIYPLGLSSILLCKKIKESEPMNLIQDNSFDCSFLVPDLKLLHSFYLESKDKKVRWKKRVRQFIRNKYIKMMKN
ncbi:hypothetical protein LZS94_10710 [Aliivibrio fischeri]|uniref:hypothetical protein n=1 Tax=Aliivibrio fischeri TaxID=668 RepID=UPI001F29712C|nr:hypothetical protein [Aliivibrio fischeri]MCE7577968.1 hypothetical protein [Aliivibrio fischeri]MCE7590356.1 hypothetical protein [Aliivibrio fischeri]